MKWVTLVVCLPALALAQSYTISTVAGIGRLPFSGVGAPAVNARLINPGHVAADSNGNIFVSDTYYHQVFRIAPSGIITVYAGTGEPGFSGDGGPATAAKLFTPQGLALDSTGNLYVADGSNARVRKISAGGTITTVVGSGQLGASGDGGPATSAGLEAPHGLAFDGGGNLYISQSSKHVIRRVAADKTITTFAGTGTADYSGDGGNATAAQLFTPLGVKVDGGGSV